MNLTFALLNNHLVHVDEVSNGLSCGCVCPKCGDDMVAKNQGVMKEHHFAHYSGSECEHGYETMLHILAKKVINDHKKVLLPRLYASIDGEITNLLISEEKIENYKKVVLEQKISDIVPDIIVYDNNAVPLIVEIKVTHGIDDIKLEKIKKIGISTIEIDLSEVQISDYYDMLDQLTTNLDIRKWVYNQEAEEIGEKLKEYSEKKSIVYRGMAKHIDNCPIHSREWGGQYYANFIDDCLNCKYNLYAQGTGFELNCLGKSKISSLDDYFLINNVKKDNEIITEIYMKDDSIKRFNDFKIETFNLFELWDKNDNKPFLARNIETGIGVFLNISPFNQHEKYRKCYGRMYKNGYYIGSREIYGALNSQWVIVEKSKNKA